MLGLQITVAIVAVLGFASLAVWMWCRGRAAQNRFDAAYTPVEDALVGKYHMQAALESGASVALPQLARAIRIAVEALIAKNRLWTREQVELAVYKLRIYVHAQNSWDCRWYNTPVAGLYHDAYRIVDVGGDLKALCHEFAEACLYQHGTPIDHQNPDGMAQWIAGGLSEAISEYQRLL